MRALIYKWTTLAFLCIVFVPEAEAQRAEKLLYWTPARLVAADFQGRKRSKDTIFIYRGARSDVHRYGTISTAIDVRVKRTGSTTHYTIRAVMNQNASWIMAGDDPVALRHEQGHFDITEIYTRIMRRELRRARSHKESESIYEAVLAAESAEHTRYDAANTYEKGGITTAWAGLIERRLKDLATYANPVVVRPFEK